MEYFVSFKTVDKDLNITITPTLEKYDTTNRNMPEVPNKITINNSVREYDAVTDGETLPTGKDIRVVDVVGPNTLLVEEMNSIII